MAFVLALGELVGCLRHPASGAIGSWVFGLSWLANPAAWAGMFFLFRGSRRRAAVAGEVALLLAACDVAIGFRLPCYALWVAGMALVVYAALEPVASTPTTADAKPARWVIGKPSPNLCMALGLPLLLGIVLLTVAWPQAPSFGLEMDEYDPNTNVHTGEQAREKFLKWAQRTVPYGTSPGALPDSATNFWFYESGGFNRSLEFGVLDCGNREDCLRAVECLGAIRRDELTPWEPSPRAVVMEGPGFYSRDAAPNKKLRGNPWYVPAIKNGLLCERNPHDRYLAYFAIDLDRNRVYCYEGHGGYPSAEYRPASERSQAKPR
jgi:hypothetical protein